MKIKLNNKVIEIPEDLNQKRLRLKTEHPDKNLRKKYTFVEEDKAIQKCLDRYKFEKILGEGMDKYDDALRNLSNR